MSNIIIKKKAGIEKHASPWFWGGRWWKLWRFLANTGLMVLSASFPPVLCNASSARLIYNPRFWNSEWLRRWALWGEIWGQAVGDLEDRNVSSPSPGTHLAPSSSFLLYPHLPNPGATSSRPLLWLASHPELLLPEFLPRRCLVSRSGLCFQMTVQQLWEWHHGTSDSVHSSVGTRGSSEVWVVGCSVEAVGEGPTS